MNEMQQLAVTARVPMVLVSAGAGSGKTRVLTHRYLELLEKQKVRVDQILTLTFTRKAAQEMRERIARMLDERKMVYERRELARAPIGTIHSFCERILREHALEAGIDPNFRLLDDAEARTLQENALDSTFEAVWADLRRQDDDLGHLLLEYPYTSIRESLLDIYGRACTQGVKIDEIIPAHGTDIPAAVQQLQLAVEELLSLTGTDNWQQGIARAQEGYRELQSIMTAAAEAFSWDLYYRVEELLPVLTPPNGPRGTAKAARDAVKEAMAHWIGACLDKFSVGYLRAFHKLLHHFDQAYHRAKDEQGLLDFNDLLLVTRALLDPASGSDTLEYFRKRFHQVMVDEFQDTNPLQFSIIRALQGDGHLFMVGDVKQAIYRFIGSDVQVFLAQEQRISAMGIDGQRIAMAVNYRTRREILGALNGLFARLWPVESTNERGGFLFEPLTVGGDFAEKISPAVEIACWSEEEGNIAMLRDREAQWIARRILQLTGRLADPALEIGAQHDGEGEGPATRPADYADVVLLFRASTDIPRYEDALRQAGIPFYVVSGRGFYQAREVQDLVHLLRVLDNPLDDFSLAVVLRSPLVGISDDTLYWLSREWSAWTPGAPYPTQVAMEPQYGRLWENLLYLAVSPDPIMADQSHSLAPSPITEEERQSLKTFYRTVQELQAELPAGQPLDLIDLILARTDYATHLLAAEGGEQRYANVQKLREVAADFQARGIFDLADFQRYLTQLSTLAPREASAPLEVEANQVVRLMTIHAAKGLEAPIVFLADGGRELLRTTSRFLLTPDGLTCQVPTPEGEWESTAVHNAAQQQLAADDLHESERLLYVALTRAREHLICCGSSKFSSTRKKTSYADLLLNLLGLDAPVAEDSVLAVSYDGADYPVRVWSLASLAATEALQPPPQPPTLWEEHQQAILSGKPLPVLVADEVEQYSRIVARLQQLPEKRRQGPLRIGVNRAICYVKCPRQYWFRYLLRSEGSRTANALSPMIEAPMESEDDLHARVDGTTFGLLLHGILQQVVFTQDILDQLDALYPTIAAEHGVASSEVDRAHLGTCLERLRQLPIYADLTRATLLQRELRFLAQEGGIFVPGIIDLLACTDDNWWILDYKTGRASADHLRQVAIYALGVQHALGVTPTRVCVAYLDTDTQYILRDEPVTPALFDDARRIIRQAGEGILREDYHPSPGRQCEYCPFLTACPEGVGAAILAAR